MPSAPYPRTITDSRGVSHRFTAAPRRIVPTAPGITEALFALGAGPRVVAVTTNCDYPPEPIKKLPRIGDMNLNPEQLLRLRPDLIVADEFLNANRITALERVKLRVFTIRPRTLRETGATLKLLGQVTGNDAAGDRLERRFSALRPSPKRPVRVLCVLSLSPLPLWAAGRQTFVDEIITLAGATNAASSGENFFQFSTEALLRAMPDVLMVTDPQADVRALVRHPVLGKLPAVRNGRVYKAPAELFVRATPRLLDGLALVRKWTLGAAR